MFNVIIKNILCCFRQNKYNKINQRFYHHNEHNDLDMKINIIIEANKKFNKNMELL
jgi:hypothetical protein